MEKIYFSNFTEFIFNKSVPTRNKGTIHHSFYCPTNINSLHQSADPSTSAATCLFKLHSDNSFLTKEHVQFSSCGKVLYNPLMDMGNRTSDKRNIKFARNTIERGLVLQPLFATS